LNGTKFLVLLNFSKNAATANTGIDLTNANLLIDNYTTANNTTALRPYEAAVYELK
jgi:oligo-1,6-glucosidase